MNIDQTFRSLPEWQHWANENTSVYSSESARKVAERVISNGFIEPLTERKVGPDQIDSASRNLREGLGAFGINSRSRAVLWLIQEKLQGKYPHEPAIFGAEALTTFAMLMRGIYPRFIGSEYGSTPEARQTLFPIPHEDLTALTFPSARFDLVTTNEVLEHVPDLDKSLSEIARILKPGGWHVGTHPFLFMNQNSDVRARLENGEVVHIKEPEYHGNPVDPEAGSLVFETPAWDIIERAKAAGFTDAHMRFVMSERHGFLTENSGVFVFCAQR